MKRGLVLEGGGVKGSYQIGAYYAFKNRHMKFNYIVGTSIGAFNAAILACGKEKSLLKFWKEIDVGLLLDFDKEFTNSFNEQGFSLKTIRGLRHTLKGVLVNHGVPTEKIKKVASELIDEKRLRKSKINFGLATLKFTKLIPTYMYTKDIKEGLVVDSIMASCYLPFFKLEKIIDNDYYLDGGFFDKCPTSMLLDKNLDEIYEVKINGIGITKKIDKGDNKIITIKPSRSLGSVLELRKQKTSENILMGYYDTLRVIKNLDGYKFCFKRKKDKYYHKLLKNTSKRTLTRLKLLLNTKTEKQTIIKALEYVLEKEHSTYYYVYSVPKVIRSIRKLKNKNIVYKFVSNLSLW